MARPAGKWRTAPNGKVQHFWKRHHDVPTLRWPLCSERADGTVGMVRDDRMLEKVTMARMCVKCLTRLGVKYAPRH